jgi:Uma2 family endonuclease
MGMPVRSDTYYTREMVLAIPEDRNRYELVYGELLMSPSPVMRHQVVLGRLYAMMYAYLEQVPVGRVLFSPADITWGSDADILVRPDLFVVAPGDVAKADWDDLRNFLLFAEVLSPSTARYDRFTKRRLYQEMKVPLYWVLDPVARQVEIWTPEALTPRFERERLAWQPDRDTASLAIELQKLFVE